MPRRSI